MTAWNPRANDLFLKALELSSPGERQELLIGACAGDRALRAEVEALLEASDKAGSFLQPSAPLLGASVDAPAPAERPGTVIGPYKLLQQIGEGGMGTVFMAEQTRPVQRRVALKVIKRGMDSSQVIARFEAERQALAMMDHVNIARVLDAGATEAGQPYFVMELVHGMPITRYCDDNHLTPRERLELFVPVCQAIQHAHQKGIIHRDIKPSNVMITLYDGKPVPKVIDFGVAKAIEQKLTERTLFTQYGTLVGTLEYMSPEQAEMSALGIDTRSDIYSLGVLLYELLTGGTPLPHKRLKEAAHAEILRMIKEEEPPKPSTRLSDSGEALASISANRHMEPAKLTKLVRGELDWIVMKCLEKDRNRRYETANGFAMDVQRYLADEPVQACPPSAGYRLRKFVRRNRGPVLAAGLVLSAVIAGVIGTSISTAMLWREKERTSAAFDRAEANLTLALEALDQIYIDEAEGHPKIREGLPKDLLQQGLGFYEKFVQENAGNKSLVFLTGNARQRAGLIFRELGEEERAVESLEGAISAYDRGLELDPRQVGFHNGRGNALGDLGRFEESLAAYDRAIEIDARHAVIHRNRSRALHELGRLEEALVACDRAVEIDPQDAPAHTARGTELRYLGRFEESLASCDRAIEIDPLKALPHNNRGNALRDLKRFEEALAEFDRAIELDPQVALAHTNRGHALHDLGRFVEALAACDRAIEINPRFASPHVIRGTVLRDLGRLDESLAAYDRAIEIDPRDADAHNNRGALLCDHLRRPGEALAEFDRAIELEPLHPDAHYNRSQALRGLGRMEEALAEFDRTIELGLQVARARIGRGNLLEDMGRFEEALAIYDRVIELDPGYAAARIRRGALLCDKLDRPGEALAEFDRAIELDSRSAVAHTNRSLALRSLRRVEESLAASDRAIEINALYATAHAARAIALGDLRRLDEALAELDIAVELDPQYADAHNSRGSVLRDLGRSLDEALAAFDRAIEIDSRHAEAHYNRGNALVANGEVEAALVAYGETIRLQPDFAEVHCNLGLALVRLGRFEEAVAGLRKGHELGSKRADWDYPSQKWLEDAERKAELEGSLDPMLSEKARQDALERIEYAAALYAMERHAESARMYAKVFADDDALAEDLAKGHRYNAACSAALAAAVGGLDAAEWRGRALEWLRTDVAAREKAATGLAATLEHWKKEPDFTSVRDRLDDLPESERAAWRGLWAAVDLALAAALPAAK